MVRALRERWRPVPDWKDYEVSTLGRVRSWKTRTSATPGAILRWLRGPQGYWQVNLHEDGVRATKQVHKLVALAFLGPRPEGMQIRHLDGNPQNPKLSNLAYGTCAENCADARVHGTYVHGESCGKSKLTEAQVLEIRSLRASGMVYREIGQLYGVSITNVYDICRRKTWTHI